MGTKNNPGQFDCYANAQPDEPMFVLLARDRLAADLVAIWSAMRSNAQRAAVLTFQNLLAEHGPHYEANPDQAKAAEAVICASAMRRWREANRPEPPAEPVDRLDDDELETIMIIAGNEQSGRITKREIRLLVEAYRKHVGGA